jgi:hypothetical protein
VTKPFGFQVGIKCKTYVRGLIQLSMEEFSMFLGNHTYTHTPKKRWGEGEEGFSVLFDDDSWNCLF